MRARRPETLLVLVCAFAASPAAAQSSVDATPAVSAPGGGSVVVSPANAAVSKLSPVSALAAPSSVVGVSAPSDAAAPTAAAAATPPSAAATAAAEQPGAARDAAAVPSAPPSVRARTPSAGTALGGTARKIFDARLTEKGGDGLSVSRALDRAFDAAAGRANSIGAAPEGGVQSLRGKVAQKIAIANTSSPADAPGLYQDAIQTAKDALPAAAAASVADVVRSFAARKADASLGDLAAAAFAAAARGSVPETGRLLSAFDKWEALLGAQGRPLISNEAALKQSAQALLQRAETGKGGSAPHVWFEKKDGSYAAVLPGSPGAGVAALPALAAAFAISRSDLAPETAIADAYRAYASDPRAATGARLVYRASRTLGVSVPTSFFQAARFWLRSVLDAFWRWIVAAFTSRHDYDFSRENDRADSRLAASQGAHARGAAAQARRLVSGARPTFTQTRAAFVALTDAAKAYRALTGESAAVDGVARLDHRFEGGAAFRRLLPDSSDELPPDLAELVSGPGGIAHWAARIEAETARALDERFWRARSGADFLNLGSESGAAASVAAAVKQASGAPLSMVVLDDHLWARGRGANGEVRLSADLRATAAGGSVELFVENGDAGVSRRLQELGLAVFPWGSGLRAFAGPEDFSKDAGDMSLLAASALAAATGAPENAEPGALRELASQVRSDPASAAGLAALLDAHAESFARAPVIGYVGEYEALAPTFVSVNGRRLRVGALRDPDTGLLSYARALRADGSPLDAAGLRALLRGR